VGEGKQGKKKEEKENQAENWVVGEYLR